MSRLLKAFCIFLSNFVGPAYFLLIILLDIDISLLRSFSHDVL